jgi:hypothetical protein
MHVAAMVSENKYPSCNTDPMASRQVWGLIISNGVPPIRMELYLVDKSIISLTRVVLPLPLAPTMAVTLPKE